MNKSKPITAILLVMTVVLMLSIFYIGHVLTNTPDKSNSPIAPIKTKAQSTSYSKIIAFNTNAGTGPGASDNSAPSPTQAVIATPTINPTLAVSLTPTSTLLAANQSVSLTPGVAVSPTQPSASASAKPTVATLPKTGNVSNAIIIFAVAGLMIFFSFLY